MIIPQIRYTDPLMHLVDSGSPISDDSLNRGGTDRWMFLPNAGNHLVFPSLGGEKDGDITEMHAVVGKTGRVGLDAEPGAGNKHYVAIDKSWPNNGQGDYSFCCLFEHTRDTATSRIQYLGGVQSGAGQGSSFLRWRRDLANDPMEWEVITSTGTSDLRVNDTEFPIHNVACFIGTYRGSSLNFYLNGNLVASDTNTGSRSLIENFTLGARPDTRSAGSINSNLHLIDGFLHSFWVWDYGLCERAVWDIAQDHLHGCQRLLRRVKVVVPTPPAAAGAFTLTADQQSYTLTGQAAALKADRTLTADQQSYTLTGQAAALLHGRQLTGDQQSYTLTGQAAALKADRNLTADQQSYALTGQAAGLAFGAQLAADQQSYTLTGQAAALKADRTLTAEQQSYTLTGQDAALTYEPVGDFTLTADQQSYTLTGQAAAFKAARTLTADQQSYTLTGQTAFLSAGRQVAADQQSYTLTGQDATLTYTPAAGDFTLTADQQSYALAGQAATLKADRALAADQQSYTLTGQTLELARGLVLPADQQSYTLTGQSAILLKDSVLLCTQQTYTLTGQTITLNYSEAVFLATAHFTSPSNRAHFTSRFNRTHWTSRS